MADRHKKKPAKRVSRAVKHVKEMGYSLGITRRTPDRWLINNRLYMPNSTMRMMAEVSPTIDLATPMPAPPFNPCGDQMGNGACGPFTAMELLCLHAERILGITLQERPSPAWIYYITRMLMGTLGQDSGVDNNTMFKALRTYGWTYESMFPYVGDKSLFRLKPSQAAIDDAKTRLVPDTHVVTQTVADVSAALAAGDGLVFSFSVPESFMDPSNQVGTTGRMTLPRANEQIIGGHDVTLVGITTVDAPGVMPGNVWPANTLKIQNHWYRGHGIPWGDGGFGYIPVDFAFSRRWSGDGGYFWALHSSGLPNPTPTPPTPIPVPVPTPTPNPPGGKDLVLHTGVTINSLTGSLIFHPN